MIKFDKDKERFVIYFFVLILGFNFILRKENLLLAILLASVVTTLIIIGPTFIKNLKKNTKS